MLVVGGQPLPAWRAFLPVPGGTDRGVPRRQLTEMCPKPSVEAVHPPWGSDNNGASSADPPASRVAMTMTVASCFSAASAAATVSSVLPL